MSSIDFRKDMLHPTTLAPPSRQRSVYTTTYHNQIDDLSYQVKSVAKCIIKKFIVHFMIQVMETLTYIPDILSYQDF